jgi:hypothetical protein
MFVCGFWDAHQDLRKNNHTLSRARSGINGKSKSYCKEKPKSPSPVSYIACELMRAILIPA